MESVKGARGSDVVVLWGAGCVVWRGEGLGCWGGEVRTVVEDSGHHEVVAAHGVSG